MKNILSRIRNIVPLAGIVVALLGAIPARASLILSIGSAIVAPGGTGSVDVWLQNTGSDAVAVGSFNIEVETFAPGVTFTSGTIQTGYPYIFVGNSAFADPDTGSIVTSIAADPSMMSGNDEQASLLFDDPATFTSVAAGDTVGLMHIVFSVAADAALGNSAISFTSWDLGTSFSDPDGVDITPANTTENFVNGTLSVESTPEPATLLLLPTGLSMLLLRRRRHGSS